MTEHWFGFALSLLAGVLAGTCMLPLKFARRWSWENVWLVFSIVSLVILPWGLALAIVKNVFEIYAALPAVRFCDNRSVRGGMGHSASVVRVVDRAAGDGAGLCHCGWTRRAARNAHTVLRKT